MASGVVRECGVEEVEKGLPPQTWPKEFVVYGEKVSLRVSESVKS